MSALNKYWSQYQSRSQTENPDISDRKAYVQFLETQLDLLEKQGKNRQVLSENMIHYKSQIEQLEDKVTNVTHLLKLQQNYFESQEDEINTLKRVYYENDSKAEFQKLMNSLEARILEKVNQQISEKVQVFGESLQNRVNNLEDVYENKKWEIEDSMHELIRKLSKKVDSGMAQLEERMHFMTNNKYSHLQETISQYRQEQKILQGRVTDHFTDYEFAQETESPPLNFKKPDLIKLERKISDHSRRLEQINLDLRHYLNCMGEVQQKIQDIEVPQEAQHSDQRITESVKKLSDLVSKSAVVQKDIQLEVHDLNMRVSKLEFDMSNNLGSVVKNEVLQDEMLLKEEEQSIELKRQKRRYKRQTTNSRGANQKRESSSRSLTPRRIASNNSMVCSNKDCSSNRRMTERRNSKSRNENVNKSFTRKFSKQLQIITHPLSHLSALKLFPACSKFPHPSSLNYSQ